MSLNSNVLIPRGIPVTVRALWLGHSVSVNLEYYSFAEKNDMQYADRLDDENQDCLDVVIDSNSEYEDIEKFERQLGDEITNSASSILSKI